MPKSSGRPGDAGTGSAGSARPWKYTLWAGQRGESAILSDVEMRDTASHRHRTTRACARNAAERRPMLLRCCRRPQSQRLRPRSQNTRNRPCLRPTGSAAALSTRRRRQKRHPRRLKIRRNPPLPLGGARKQSISRRRHGRTWAAPGRVSCRFECSFRCTGSLALRTITAGTCDFASCQDMGRCCKNSLRPSRTQNVPQKAI